MWNIVARDNPPYDKAMGVHYDRIVLESTRVPPHPTHIQHALQNELDELNAFDRYLESFLQDQTITDPTKSLHKTYKPSLGAVIPDIYILSKGDWEAYFHLDRVTTTATCILTRNIKDPITTSLLQFGP